MTYVEQWRPLSARIRAFVDAAHLYANFQQSSTSDSYGGAKYLGDQSQRILASVVDFAAANKGTLPPEALQALEQFIAGHPGNVIRGQESSREIRAGAIFLAGLESEIAFLLSDRQEILRARSERAFLHLQRSLAVDMDLRARWLAAYNATAGEVRCEGLGSVHFLGHGIYAFKVDARGARTDLVFNEPADPLIDPRGLEGLVLTEWKVVDEKNAPAQFVEARKQADLYAQGPLLTSELRGYRYLVAVSLKDLPQALIPDDLTIGSTIYRHINISIEPDAPSKRAKK